MEAQSPLSDLAPRSGARARPQSLPSFTSDADVGMRSPAPGQPNGSLTVSGRVANTLPDFGDPGFPDRTAELTRATPEPPSSRQYPDAPARLPRFDGPVSTMSREAAMQGGIVSDDYEDEDAEGGLSWRIVFAVAATAMFAGAVFVVGFTIYLAQQPSVTNYAQELVLALLGDEDAVATVEVVEEPEDVAAVPDAEALVEAAEPAEEAEAEEAGADDPTEAMEVVQAAAVVATKVDPKETFEAVEALDPTPPPAPAPRPEPPAAPPTDLGEILTRTEPPPEPEDKPRRARKRDREPEPASDPARVEFELPPPPPPIDAKIAPAEMDRWSKSAFDGRLSPGSAERLTAIEIDDPQFTRARTLLYLDAKKRGRVEERRGHLGLLMKLPENQYNPVLLVEHAQEAMEQKQYRQALARAEEAEQHWARIPSSLLFTRKALIYEIEAVAHTGMFFESEGQDLNELQGAIRGWEKFQRHVSQKGRTEMAKRAEQQLKRLRDLEERLK